MTKKYHRRRIKLINPRLQLKVVMAFVGLSAMSLILQFLFLASRVSRLAMDMPHDGPLLLAVLPDLLIDILLISFGILLPLTVAVGVLVVFRIAGPIYRFEQFLKAVHSGEQTDICRIRKGDELHSFCALLNEVTEPLREQNAVIQEEAAKRPDDDELESVDGAAGTGDGDESELTQQQVA